MTYKLYSNGGKNIETINKNYHNNNHIGNYRLNIIY